MKVGPKSSLRPFLHRALQLFPESKTTVSANRRRVLYLFDSTVISVWLGYLQ